jgi:PKD repeat protein
MAKVTVTDPDGATGTAEIEIIVTDPPNRPPSVRAAADPGSGDAPLDVRFSAEGTDPDGDSLVYEWDFGDGGRAFGAQATHRYSSPGDYDATVTVTDPDGATGTATVHVTVSGNRAPSVTMTADPQSGTAPLRVRFEAQGSDPEGSSLTYRWSFGDGSRPETGRLETHTYRNPGTYTARVTATDREGASSTAELEITVTQRPVNQAPSVTMTATPQTGAEPLPVSFVAEGSDPEGGLLTYRWSFGDDSDSSYGREVTHEYRRRGTYTARVTVTDPQGARESAELRITVTRSGGS